MVTSSASVKKKRPVPKKKVATTSAPSTSTTTSDAPAKKPVRKKVEPAKRVPRKAVAAKKTTTVRKTKPVPSATSKKTPAKKSRVGLAPRPTNELGFVDGTDSALIAQAFMEGGFDRNEVNANAEKLIADTNGLENRNGGTKYVPSIASSILSRMLASGNFKVESSWKLVPTDTPVERAPRTRVVGKRVQGTPAKAAPAKPAKKTATKAVRRRPVK